MLLGITILTIPNAHLQIVFNTHVHILCSVKWSGSSHYILCDQDLNHRQLRCDSGWTPEFDVRNTTIVDMCVSHTPRSSDITITFADGDSICRVADVKRARRGVNTVSPIAWPDYAYEVTYKYDSIVKLPLTTRGLLTTLNTPTSCLDTARYRRRAKRRVITVIRVAHRYVLTDVAQMIVLMYCELMRRQDRWLCGNY